MDITVFSHFFENNITTLCQAEIQSFKIQVNNKYFESVYRNLIENVGQDMVRALLPEYNIFILEHSEDDKNMTAFCNYITTEKFLDYFYLKYKMLKSKLIRRIKDTLNYALEVYNNFHHNKKRIEEEFSCNIGDIIDICLGVGDLHDGKTACKVETESLVLFYKPVNGNSISLFYKVMDFLIDGENIHDKRIKYVSYDNHVWMEEVIYKECSKIEEVREYFFMSGIYLFAFYIMNTFDMHHENIINYGSTPVIIDFETLTLLSTNKLKAEGFRESVNSVLNTLFIPFINDAGAFDVNVSGILSETCKSEKEYYEYGFSESKGITAEKKKVEFFIDNQLKLNGENVLDRYITLEEIRKLLRSGFGMAGEKILKKKELFKNSIFEFLNKEFVEFRQLLRPTEVYANFVFATYHPDSLISKRNTDKVLMILQNNFKPSSFGYLRVEKEIEDIEKGYIPKFYAYYNSKNLYSNGKVVCVDYFCDTVKEKIEGKVDSLDLETVKYQKKLIDLSLLFLMKQKDFGKTNIRPFTPQNINRSYVKRCAYEVIRYFEEIEIRYNEHEVSTFLAPHLATKENMWRIRESDSNLYEYGAIVLVCAYYGKIYNEYDKIDFAIRIMDYFNSLLDQKSLSVFNGMGSLLYLNIKMHQILQNIPAYRKNTRIYKENYEHFAETILNKIIDSEIKDKDFDFIQGAFSSIYLLCKLFTNIDEDSTTFVKLKKVKEKVLENFDGNTINDIGYAHGLTGCAVILSEISRLFPDKKINSIIEELIDKENQLIEDLGIHNLPSTWCRGTSGLLLGRDTIYRNICFDNPECKELGEKLKRYEYEMSEEKSIQKMLSMDNLCVCHGVYGNIEVLRYLKMYGEHKSQIYTSRFNSFEEINWLNNVIDVPIHSFMLGNLGITYVLLGMVSDEVSSFLVLDV